KPQLCCGLPDPLAQHIVCAVIPFDCSERMLGNAESLFLFWNVIPDPKENRLFDSVFYKE
ncbi:MAG TPA: hypothetical protein PKA19_14735, partial [Bacillota bacterium]|nr:hypothetical protein [Bacillota bacterium]